MPSATNRSAISWLMSFLTFSIQFTSRRITRISKSSESAPNPMKTTFGGGFLKTMGCASAISRRILSTLRVSVP